MIRLIVVAALDDGTVGTEDGRDVVSPFTNAVVIVANDADDEAEKMGALLVRDRLLDEVAD